MSSYDSLAIQTEQYIGECKHKLEGTTYQLEEAVKYHTNRCGVFQKRLAEADATISILKKKHEQMIGFEQMLLSELIKRQGDTDECSGMDEAQQVAALKTQLKNTVNQVDQLEASASRKDEELARLQSLLAARDYKLAKITECMRPVLGLLEHDGAMLEEHHSIIHTIVKLKNELSRLRAAVTGKSRDLIKYRKTLDIKQEQLDDLNRVCDQQRNDVKELERSNTWLEAKYARLEKDNELLVVKQQCLKKQISTQHMGQNIWEALDHVSDLFFKESEATMRLQVAIRIGNLYENALQSLAKKDETKASVGTAQFGITHFVEDVMGVKAQQETQTGVDHGIADGSQTETQYFEIQADAEAHGCTDDHHEVRDVGLEDVVVAGQDESQLDSVDGPAYDWALDTSEGGTNQKETHGEGSLDVTQQAVENQAPAEFNEAVDDYHMVGTNVTQRDDAHLLRAQLLLYPLDSYKMHPGFPSSHNSLANHDASYDDGTMTPGNVSIADDEWEVLNNCSEL